MPKASKNFFMIIIDLNAKLGKEEEGVIVGKYGLESHERLGLLLHREWSSNNQYLIWRTLKIPVIMEKSKRAHIEPDGLSNNQ